jgi:hypothetical protein
MDKKQFMLISDEPFDSALSGAPDKFIFKWQNFNLPLEKHQVHFVLATINRPIVITEVFPIVFGNRSDLSETQMREIWTALTAKAVQYQIKQFQDSPKTSEANEIAIDVFLGRSSSLEAAKRRLDHAFEFQFRHGE